MCGIVGYVCRHFDPDLNPAFLRRACRAMQHRGPDGEGTWSDGRVGLGHRRLSIIDLAGGSQPMSFGEGRYWITFNGEIYNYRQLRRELDVRGHTFRTSSDTEVILAGYAEWGSRVPAWLRGIFAFAIWDRKEGRLFLSRDHLGVKPLLYYSSPEHLIFSSELKALFEADSVARELDPAGLCDYLALGYVLGSKTVVRNVCKLPPGTSLIWEDGRITLQPYWDLATIASTLPGQAQDEEEAVASYSDHLQRAVASQMVSDVPVGAFLSGGIDSSTVAYHMRSQTPHRLATFSMGFAEPTYSELDYAQAVANALKTDHHAERVRAELEADLPALVRGFDEPLGDTSIIPTYFVSRVASRNVKVVLSGDGADESLAGYDTYVADKLQQLYRRLPAFLHKHLFLPVSRWIPSTRRKVGLDYKLKQFISHAYGEIEQAHYGWRLLFEAPERRVLLGNTGDYDPLEAYRAYYDRVRSGSPLNRLLYLDISTWLANDILPKVDRAAMAVGLEARVPFLDVDLVEFTMRLPSEMKMRGFQRKVILKRAMAGKLPPWVLKRRKSGFNAPVSDWLRGSLRGLVQELLTKPSQLVDLRQPLVGRLWQAHLAGTEDHGFRLWSLLSLLLWEREVLRRPTARYRLASEVHGLECKV